MATRKHLPKEERQKETAEQRKERYAENKRKKEALARQQRREEMSENETANRRLSFLANIFKATGHNYSDIAKLCNTTQQSMSWIFSVMDDCRLSQAEQFLRVIGLDLKVELTNKNKQNKEFSLEDKKEGVNSGVHYTIQGDINEILKWTNPKMPDYINECSKDKRMYFLAKYIPNVGMNITELTERFGIEMTSLRYIFQKDDIKISKIFDIARATDAEITWKVNRIK